MWKDSPFFKGLLSFYTLSNTKDRFSIIISLLFIIVSTSMTILTPYLFKSLIERQELIANGYRVEHFILIVYLILWMLGKTNIFIREIIITSALENWKKNLSLKFFTHVISKFYINFTKPEVGESIATIEKIQNEAPHFILTTLLLIVPIVIEVCIISFLLAIQYGIHLGIISLSIFLFVLYTNHQSSKQLIHYQKLIKQTRKEIIRFANDRFNNISTVLTSGMKINEVNEYGNKLDLCASLEIKNRIYVAKSNLIQTLIISTIFGYITIWSYHRVTLNLITVYDFILINALLVSIISPIYSFSLVFRNIRRSIEEIKAILSIENGKDFLLNDGKICFECLSDPGKIELDNVSFGYGKSVNILSEVSHTFQHGTKTVIVGPSGVGKSTLCCLISHLLPKQGSIKIGNIERRHLSYVSLSKNLSVLAQNQGLFTETLLYNLTYGCEYYEKRYLEKIIQALKLNDLIRNLSNGIHSKIMTFGDNLSDGQKQKILIARLLIKKPKIVILDEATSNLDLQSEALVYKVLFNFLTSSTFIVVNHRLSSVVQHSDKIIVLSEKQISDVGSHEFLLQNNKIYRSLWKLSG